MLCGAIWSAAPVSLRGLAPPLPPRPALLAALVMHALHASDESSFIDCKFPTTEELPRFLIGRDLYSCCFAENHR
ncbi:unnamed protein product [Euphydryas editha]|uniref:Secreted protein n=1 Tax=Euphydryas editha TaxID=104508 RepID=A0AAU9TRZ9_EUPED|nr:unnamed protein product [Euphydryas editha]